VKLQETLRALFDANVEFVLIGGAAMQMQGSAHLTEDLDFCYARSSKNLERLALALAPHHPRLRGAPENLPFRFDAATIKHGLNFTLMTDLGWIDFLGEVAGLGGYEEVKKNSEVMAIFEMDCLVLSLEGLIRAKKAAGRSRDLEVIPELEGLLDLRKRSQK
jgi:predicted nucleotidyltransferase